MNLSRRKLFAGFGAVLAMPAIVRADTIMRVSVPKWCVLLTGSGIPDGTIVYRPDVTVFRTGTMIEPPLMIHFINSHVIDTSQRERRFIASVDAKFAA